jgi:acyl-CoA dehydrogenase
VELRDSEAYLLGGRDVGIYAILEALNLSRVANSMGSVGVALRAMAEALTFAEGRVAFGKPIIQHPLLKRQFEERVAALEGAFALSWEAARQLDAHWLGERPYPESFHLFRLTTHLAKYWTSELAPQIARWGMEVHGGLGVLEEFPAERWFREAMVLTIWEGTCHRQILDGIEVMERKGAHRPLLEMLKPTAGAAACEIMAARLDSHLALPAAEREAGVEELFRDLATFTANTLAAALKSGGKTNA